MKPNALRSLLTAITLCMLLSQCEHSDVLNRENALSISSLVSSHNAVKVAATFWQTSSTPKARTSFKTSLAIPSTAVKKITSYVDKMDTIFHVIEHEQGGWTVVSADKRLEPILAYSETGYFSLSNVPGPIQSWINKVTSSMKQARMEPLKLNSPTNLAWQQYEKTLQASSRKSFSTAPPTTNVQQPLCDPNNIYCPADFSKSVGPIMPVLYWGQGGGYTFYSPDRITQSNCANCFNRAYTGCGPLAVAMVLFYFNKVKFFDKPSGYNFTTSSIASPCGQLNPGELEIARLIKYAGDNTSTNYNEPSCNTATLDVTSTTIPFSRAGYSDDGEVVDFYSNRDYVRRDLDLGYPVIFSGTTCGTCLGSYHIWVCDGYSLSKSYTPTCIGGPQGHPVCMDYTTERFHLKWGQYTAWDGWYGLGNFRMDGDAYDTYMKAHIGIRP